MSLSFSPSYSRAHNYAYYVTSVTDPTATSFYGSRYVLAMLDQPVLGLDTRASFTFTPTMTLEVYAQPFFAAGRYTDFEEYVAPRSKEVAVYGRDSGTIAAVRDSTGRVAQYAVDPDGAGPAKQFTFDNPNFSQQSLRGNAVFRWEYRPGSVVYVAWTQSRAAGRRIRGPGLPARPIGALSDETGQHLPRKSKLVDSAVGVEQRVQSVTCLRPMHNLREIMREQIAATKRLAFHTDWEAMDPIVWSPWGTILVGEETNAAVHRDPKYPNAVAGLMYEIFLNPNDPSVADSVVARPALGSKSHEGTRFDPQGNVYGIAERNPGYVYKFVPDRRGDLSSGQLFVLKIVSPTVDRTGDAQWIPLDRNAVQIDAAVAADNVNATGYNRPEDIEIATSTGNARGGANRLFVAVTAPSGPADNRVLAIDLRDGPGAGAFVFDYVRIGLNAPADFEFPDNLALDRSGNLYIAEDPGGSSPSKKKGDDIWVATPPTGVGQQRPAASVVRFATLTDCDAEPTGIYFGLHGNVLYVNAQHRGGDHLDKAVAISPR